MVRKGTPLASRVAQGVSGPSSPPGVTGTQICSSVWLWSRPPRRTRRTDKESAWGELQHLKARRPNPSRSSPGPPLHIPTQLRGTEAQPGPEGGYCYWPSQSRSNWSQAYSAPHNDSNIYVVNKSQKRGARSNERSSLWVSRGHPTLSYFFGRKQVIGEFSVP